ncbi:MAG TPA: universal stress protein [Solirubrobacterales bacterium]|nr:universal stress protein [Solirubrobacterales bacterium]
MRLLVGVDGRQGGEDAGELARVLCAGAADPRVRLVTVLFPGPLPTEYALLSEAEISEAGGDVAEPVRQRLAEIPTETLVYGGGSPAGILTRVAEQEEFDAVVVGSPHRGALGRVLIGNVAGSLLNGASTDVAVAPKGYAEAEHRTFRKIAVGYDGSAEADAALRRAEALARPVGARLEVVTVVSPPVGPPPMVPGVYAPQLPPEPQQVIDRGVEAVEADLTVEGIRLDGDPAMELLRHCEGDVDLLVLGSRGYGPLSRVLLGSVSHKVVTDAPCPVLVAKRP